MSFWSNPFMNWFENFLLKLTNFVWKKRHPIKQAAAKPAATKEAAPAAAPQPAAKKPGRKPRAKQQ